MVDSSAELRCMRLRVSVKCDLPNGLGNKDCKNFFDTYQLYLFSNYPSRYEAKISQILSAKFVRLGRESCRKLANVRLGGVSC